MDNLQLSNREWLPFFIEDIAEIESGRDIYERERIVGNVPYITSTANNNGIGYFVGNNNESLEAECLSVNRNGSVGYCFYHPYQALYGNDTRKLRPKVKSKYIALFLSMCITNQKGKYGYGYKMGTGRLKRQHILLPVNNQGEPDWQFMEDYMRSKEEKLLNIIYEYQGFKSSWGGGKIQPHKWKSFHFTEVFTEIQRGKRFKKSNHQKGDIPYVSSTSFDNGVDGFVGYDGSVRVFADCLTLANSGSVGSTFYHKYTFVASDHVTKLKRPGLDKYAYLFMIPIINRLSEKYSFNREINEQRIKREQLILPVTDSEEIDFEFMSSYMKQLETEIMERTLKMFAKVNSI